MNPGNLVPEPVTPAAILLLSHITNRELGSGQLMTFQMSHDQFPLLLMVD